MTQTVPERPETLAAQVEWLRQGKRIAVLITTGARVPALPAGMEAVVGKNGVYVFNPKKTDAKTILWAENDDRIGDVLGYGTPNKPETECGCVVVRAANGLEKQAVVTDAASIEGVMSAAHAVADPGDTVRLEKSEDVLAQREGQQDCLRMYPKLRPLKDGDLKQLVKAAGLDNHRVLAPTYVVEMDGVIVGYIGLNSLPVFQGWFNTERVRARESCAIFNQVENLCRMQGMDHLALLLPVTSPFTDKMERFGYQEVATVTMQLKRL